MLGEDVLNRRTVMGVVQDWNWDWEEEDEDLRRRRGCDCAKEEIRKEGGQEARWIKYLAAGAAADARILWKMSPTVGYVAWISDAVAVGAWTADVVRWASYKESRTFQTDPCRRVAARYRGEEEMGVIGGPGR